MTLAIWQRYMFEHELSAKIIAVSSAAKALENADVCIIAIPAQIVKLKYILRLLQELQTHITVLSGGAWLASGESIDPETKSTYCEHCKRTVSSRALSAFRGRLSSIGKKRSALRRSLRAFIRIRDHKKSPNSRFLFGTIIYLESWTIFLLSAISSNSFIFAVVVASKYLYHAVFVQRLLTTAFFRCYTSQDVIGVELGGALKNPLAIGAGLIEGNGL